MEDDEEKLTRQDENVLKNLDPEERRNKIRELQQRDGMDRETLANIFGVSVSTIDKDRQKIKDENIEEVTEIDKQEQVGSHIKFFRQLISEAWKNYRSVDIEEQPRIKQEYFRVLKEVRDRLIEIQFKTGLIPQKKTEDWINTFDLDIGDNSSGGNKEAKAINDLDNEELEDFANDIEEEMQKLEEHLDEEDS